MPLNSSEVAIGNDGMAAPVVLSVKRHRQADPQLLRDQAEVALAARASMLDMWAE